MGAKEEQKHPTFTVDTHLFRELGELLVGRDSTALVELVKNSYDADATEVVVYGERLSIPGQGFITIRDNGSGMDRQEFEEGFLRIASRKKELGQRRSPRFGRRYTGAKGIGRLAVHKLAHKVEVVSFRSSTGTRIREPRSTTGVEASIQWDVIEAHTTLESLKSTDAITVQSLERHPPVIPGTTITLRNLRSAWSSQAHTRFLEEIQTFAPSPALTEPLPKSVVRNKLLFDRPVMRDATGKAGGSFEVRLEGDLAPPDAFFEGKAEASTWILEIEAMKGRAQVIYAIAPSKQTKTELPDAKPKRFEVPHPSPQDGPFFQARVLIRTGKAWERRTSGVRVFVEGFRVLPYGEDRNDWLRLDRDVSERARIKPLARHTESSLDLFSEAEVPKDDGLLILPNKHYLGAIFLTQQGASSLRLLVNREGFIPNPAYDTLVTLVRGGLDLATRVRAAATKRERSERRAQRAKGRSANGSPEAAGSELKATIGRWRAAAENTRRDLASGKVDAAVTFLNQMNSELVEIDKLSEAVIDELAMLRVLASVGTQMSAFVHEINSLIGTAESVDSALRRIREKSTAERMTARERRDLVHLTRIMGDLRRSLERQASYLVDVIAPDARRRRSRQAIAERFGAAAKLVGQAAEARLQLIENRIPQALQSPAMFPAELTTVFSNLLSNAVKAAGRGGRIRATGRALRNAVIIRVENTGSLVRPEVGEKWFRPFESSTTRVDPVLGQGMGLGLPITRSVLADYGGTIRFVTPSSGFATSLEITLPVSK